MIDTNELRRLAQAAISKMNALDPEFVSSVTPLAVLELLDRLEAAEKAVTEAYRRGYETGQEEIAAELEFAKREVANLHDDIHELTDERDALRAKIAEMEKQEPVAEWIENRFHHYPQLDWAAGYKAVIGEKLYALPGAKGE